MLVLVSGELCGFNVRRIVVVLVSDELCGVMSSELCGVSVR